MRQKRNTGPGSDNDIFGGDGLHPRKSVRKNYIVLLLEITSHGIYCEAGDFFIDPWEPVDRAIITHAHPDHFVAGCGAYLVPEPGVGLLREQVGAEIGRAHV